MSIHCIYFIGTSLWHNLLYALQLHLPHTNVFHYHILLIQNGYQKNYSGIPCIYHAIPDIYGDLFIYQLGFYERGIWIFKGIQTDVF